MRKSMFDSLNTDEPCSSWQTIVVKGVSGWLHVSAVVIVALNDQILSRQFPG